MNPLFAFGEAKIPLSVTNYEEINLEWDHPVWISLLWMGFGA
jgi:hypothetical protein